MTKPPPPSTDKQKNTHDNLLELLKYHNKIEAVRNTLKRKHTDEYIQEGPGTKGR